MKTIKYQCDINNYCAERLWGIRSHIHGLCRSDQEQFNGDVIYRIVNGVTDETWLRTIVVLPGGRVLFRKQKPFVTDSPSFPV